ncbi:hypothetical protein JCM5353_000514 [Sporobolomyces roseus]
MTTRSRTNLFLSYRDSCIRDTTPTTPFLSSSSSSSNPYALDQDQAENAALLDNSEDDWSRRGSTWSTVSSSSKGKARQNDVLPPQWLDYADKVDEIVQRVKPKITQLDKLHSKHLLPGFKDRSAEEREIENLATSITTDLRTCQLNIRKIAEQSKQLLQETTTSTSSQESKRLDLLMAANVQTALATKVQALSSTFRKKQSEYLRLLKGNENRNGIGGSSKVTNQDPLASLAEDEQYSRSVLSPTTPSLAQQQLFSPSLSQSQSHLESTITQRSSEISSIAQSITDLADLFKDLNSLVIDQGSLLDRIDYNVEQMSREVKGAVTELQQATRYQKRSGKCQLIFLLVLLITGCLIVIAYRPSRSSTTPSPITDSTGETGGSEAGRIANQEEIAQKLTEELDGRRLRRSASRTADGIRGARRRDKWR